jgi:hypothetical protein
MDPNHFGDLIDRQTHEKTQFDDPYVTRIFFLQLCQDIIEGLSVGGLLYSTFKDFLRCKPVDWRR